MHSFQTQNDGPAPARNDLVISIVLLCQFLTAGHTRPYNIILDAPTDAASSHWQGISCAKLGHAE